MSKEIKFPKCVYKKGQELGLCEDVEYKIIHSVEELEALGADWGGAKDSKHEAKKVSLRKADEILEKAAEKLEEEELPKLKKKAIKKKGK